MGRSEAIINMVHGSMILAQLLLYCVGGAAVLECVIIFPYLLLNLNKLNLIFTYNITEHRNIGCCL